MKKRSVIMLLSLALLGAFSVNVAAEEAGEMTEAAAETEAQEEVSMVQGSYSVKSEEAIGFLRRKGGIWSIIQTGRGWSIPDCNFKPWL